jgi:hypothetical protein
LLSSAAEDQGSVVKGAVTLDGKPLDAGQILFVSVDQSSPTVEATVQSGSFEAIVSPGEKRIEIRAPKVAGKKKLYNTPDSPTVDAIVDLLPARYNVNSELTLTVDGAEQVHDFDLKSK